MVLCAAEIQQFLEPAERGVLALFHSSKSPLGAPPKNPNGEPRQPNEGHQAMRESERDRDHDDDRIEASH